MSRSSSSVMASVAARPTSDVAGRQHPTAGGPVTLAACPTCGTPMANLDAGFRRCPWCGRVDVVTTTGSAE